MFQGMRRCLQSEHRRSKNTWYMIGYRYMTGLVFSREGRQKRRGPRSNIPSQLNIIVCFFLPKPQVDGERIRSIIERSLYGREGSFINGV